MPERIGGSLWEIFADEKIVCERKAVVYGPARPRVTEYGRQPDGRYLFTVQLYEIYDVYGKTANFAEVVQKKKTG